MPTDENDTIGKGYQVLQMGHVAAYGYEGSEIYYEIYPLSVGQLTEDDGTGDAGEVYVETMARRVGEHGTPHFSPTRFYMADYIYAPFPQE